MRVFPRKGTPTMANTEAEERLAALEQEKEGYVRRGLPERASDVGKAIAAIKREMSKSDKPETPEKKRRGSSVETPEG